VCGGLENNPANCGDSGCTAPLTDSDGDCVCLTEDSDGNSNFAGTAEIIAFYGSDAVLDITVTIGCADWPDVTPLVLSFETPDGTDFFCAGTYMELAA
jgi:hypothetical protein